MTISELYAIFKQSNKVSTDTRSLQQNDLFFALSGDNFNGNTFAKDALNKGASYAIIDDENYISTKTILVANVLKTLQELAQYHRTQLNIPIIALTGSNGKTTSKELINCVLSKKYNTSATLGNLNNHIGVPLTLLNMDETTEIGIVEMGANHFNEIAFLSTIAQPDYGYITNFGKAHLEGFGDLNGVIKAKSELYEYLRHNNKTVFLHADNHTQVKQAAGITSINFSEQANTNTQIQFISANPTVTVQYKQTLIHSKLIGDYNYTNIAAAICIGAYFKVPLENIATAISNYEPTNNRSQIVVKNTNTIILDAYNANPTSMRAALDSFEQQATKNKIVFLGDMFELGKTSSIEHQAIVDYLETLPLTQCYVLGEHFKATKRSAKIIAYSNFKELSLQYNNKPLNASILIKGSRGMALERILELL